jgi:DNA primase
MIPDEIIGKVKKANKLEDIVSKYIKLSKISEGAEWLVGKCPFHDEEDGSFKVNRNTQTWYCYSCGKGTKDENNLGSDIIAFVREIEHIGFEEAIEYLAKEADIEFVIKPEDPEVKEEKRQKTLQNARYYKNLWNKNNQQAINALNYLYERGLTNETIHKWRLGLVPNDEIKYRTDILDIAGKIAFPMIENSKKETPSTLSMTYRSPGSDYYGPKYKNDKNSICFRKSHFVYGLNFAHKAIKTKNFGIIVECYFGTIVLHQEGIENVVSIMGTNLSDEQLYQMKKYSNNWIFMLDGDEAGYKGMVKALPKMISSDINVDIAILPDGVDPDEFILKIGKNKFKQWLGENKRSLIDHVINKKLNLYEERVNKMKIDVLNSLNNILEPMQSPKINVYKSMINKRLDV